MVPSFNSTKVNKTLDHAFFLKKKICFVLKMLAPPTLCMCNHPICWSRHLEKWLKCKSAVIAQLTSGLTILLAFLVLLTLLLVTFLAFLSRPFVFTWSRSITAVVQFISDFWFHHQILIATITFDFPTTFMHAISRGSRVSRWFDCAWK